MVFGTTFAYIKDKEGDAVKAKSILITILAITSLLMTACGTKLEPQEHCNFTQNSSMQRLSWKGNFPVKMYIHNSVPLEYIPAIEAAGETWNKVFGYKVFAFVPGVGSNENPGQDGYNFIYYSNTWDPQQTDEQARTTIYWTGARLVESDVSINAKNFNYFVDETQTLKNQNKIHLESLMVHELGHVLGLSHYEKSGTVMATSLSPNQIRTKPSEEDVASIACEYQTY